MMGHLTTALALAAGAAVVLGSGCAADYYDDDEISATYLHIVNGELNPGDPAVGLFFLGGGTCTGTMITNKVMVSARHCVVDANGVAQPIGDMAVYWGTNPAPEDPSIPVVSYDYHPAADIAVVELAQPAGVAPIPMNTQDLKPMVGQPVRVAGYGVTAENNRDSGTKRNGSTQLFQLESRPTFGEIMFIGNVGSKTCYGDSGGPAFMTIGGVEQIVGVTSFGTGPCEAENTLDGQVRIDSYHSWIMEFVNQKDPGGLPAALPGTPGGTTPLDPGAPSNNLVGGCSVAGSSAAGWLAPAMLLALFLAVRRRRD